MLSRRRWRILLFFWSILLWHLERFYLNLERAKVLTRSPDYYLGQRFHVCYGIPDFGAFCQSFATLRGEKDMRQYFYFRQALQTKIFSISQPRRFAPNLWRQHPKDPGL